jgi:AcrR family transcriptional regulator
MPQTLQPGAANMRERFRELVRESILDAAWGRIVEHDWDSVRISDIAADAGVSRQAVYKEVGAKDRIASLLIEREVNRFLEGVLRESNQADTLQDGVRAAFTWFLAEASAHPIVERIRTRALQGRTEPGLLLLTVRADSLLRPVREGLVELYCGRWQVQPAVADQIIDAIIRLTVSWLLAPPDQSPADLVEFVVTMAARLAPAS